MKAQFTLEFSFSQPPHYAEREPGQDHGQHYRALIIGHHEHLYHFSIVGEGANDKFWNVGVWKDQAWKNGIRYQLGVDTNLSQITRFFFWSWVCRG